MGILARRDLPEPWRLAVKANPMRPPSGIMRVQNMAKHEARATAFERDQGMITARSVPSESSLM